MFRRYADPDRGAHDDGGGRQAHRQADQRPQLLGHQHRVFDVAQVAQQHHEAVSVHAGDRVGAAHRGPQPVGGGPQRPVAGVVPVLGIDPRDAVEIDGQHGAGLALVGGPSQRLLQPVLEQGAGGQGRQGVEVRQVQHLGVQAVLHHRDGRQVGQRLEPLQFVQTERRAVDLGDDGQGAQHRVLMLQRQHHDMTTAILTAVLAHQFALAGVVHAGGRDGHAALLQHPATQPRLEFGPVELLHLRRPRTGRHEPADLAVGEHRHDAGGVGPQHPHRGLHHQFDDFGFVLRGQDRLCQFVEHRQGGWRGSEGAHQCFRLLPPLIHNSDPQVKRQRS